MNDPRKIILAPLVTEKVTGLREKENCYGFKVAPNATKSNIKMSIEELFHVDVLEVRTMNMPGKIRRRGRNVGKTSAWKKAIIKVKEGQIISIFEGI
ncbi:50S ribosomal protein L23 [bacterium]|nr:50S ribosomal protein L23 [bacterium]